MLGQILGDYELQQEIGRGSAATVYVARQHPVERYVALKLFDAQSREVTAQLRQLFSDLMILDHTHILPLYATDRWQDHLYWVTRYMPAGSLKARLRGQRLTLEEVDLLLPEVASALDYAHGHNLFHGDLKPSDILLDHAGHAFVADFGLAPALGRTTSSYQAPELRRAAEWTARGDVYSLGVVLYELLTGRLPINPLAPEEEKINRRLVPPAPSAIVSKLPTALDAVALKALTVDPDQRHATPGELAEDYAQARQVRKARAAPIVVAAVAAPATAEVSSRVRRVSPRRSTGPRVRRSGWRIAGFIGGAIIALLMIVVVGLSIARSPAAAPASIATATPTVAASPPPAITPTPTAMAPPSQTPAPTGTPRPTSTPTSVASPTSTPRPTIAATRVLPAVTPVISIAPLTLAFPRSEGRDSLSLTFGTNVLPADAGIIGTLSMSVPAVEPFVTDRMLAQVGSGEQVLQVGVSINCGKTAGSVTSDQVVLTIGAQDGRVLLTQPVEYVKRWCE